ncbi:MAG TPA: hypothetical protein EYN51_10745 [Flavobacteriales bacterium]|nr:hypothetical protein [Flavobacteriales bacterium]
MSDYAAPSRLGVDKTTNASFAQDNALFLEVFGGEVLNAFNTANVTMSRHKVRTISEGKTARFPSTWKTTAYTHVPGEILVPKSIEHTEMTISIDDLLVAPVFIDRLDEAKNHYEVRREYSKQVGEVLGNTMDANVLRNMVIAANTATRHTNGDGGSVLGANLANVISGDLEVLIDAIFASLKRLDEKNVPGVGRQVFVRPLEWYGLLRAGAALGAALSGNATSPIGSIMDRDVGGNGNLTEGVMPRIGGAELIKSNNIPQADETQAGVDEPGENVNSKYRVDSTDIMALVNTGDCVGTVKLLDLAMEQEYDITRQGHLIVGKYAVGHGVLRSECAVAISDAASLTLTA